MTHPIWRAELTPCGKYLGIVSLSENKPVCLLGLTGQLDPGNVRLIESAPDLAGAVQDLLELADSLIPLVRWVDRGGIDGWRSVEQRIAAVRSVLRQATEVTS